MFTLRGGYLSGYLIGLLLLVLLGGNALAWAEVANPRFVSAHFSGSQNCADCHNRYGSASLLDENGKDLSIEEAWSGSMMANAARDPLWRAKVATELKRNPHLSDVINDKCSRCHAPMANYEAQRDGVPFTILGEGGLLDPQNPYYSLAMDGVSCTVCHQIADTPTLGTLESFSGHYEIAAGRPAYGQYAAPVVTPMLRNSGYTPTFSHHISDSALCATCHNLKTPYVDAEGQLLTTTPASEFPEQMVYSEWEASRYAHGETQQSCQQCHMPRAEGAVKIANRPLAGRQAISPRSNFAQHTLVGGNTLMMEILANHRQELEVTSNQFEQSVAETRTLLQTAADLEIETLSAANGTLHAVVRVTNQSGHKLPTSYPSRRVVLHLTLLDEQGQTRFESGRIDAQGRVVGLASEEEPGRYEPHHTLIRSPDQAQIYESVMGDSDGELTHTLLRGARYLKDNRLVPAGFDKHRVEEDIAVRGGAFDDPDFNLGEDRVTYQLPIATAGRYRLVVRLLYQPLRYDFLQDLWRDNELPEVADFQRMYGQSSIRYEVIQQTEATLEISPEQATASCSPSAITLSSLFYASPFIVRSEQQLIVVGEQQLAPGATLLYQAPRILFAPGFWVTSGSAFTATAGAVVCVGER